MMTVEQKKLYNKIVRASNELQKYTRRGKLQWAWIPEILVPTFIELGIIKELK